jgi:hypothetical protein
LVDNSGKLDTTPALEQWPVADAAGRRIVAIVLETAVTLAAELVTLAAEAGHNGPG